MPAKDFTRALWLFLVAKGGWWRVPDIILERPGWATTTALRRQVSHVLKGLSQHGCCVRRLPVGSVVYEYAVTENCNVVQGITVKELQRAASGTAPEFSA